MPALFAEHLAKLEADVDAQFGERFRYQPMIAAVGGGRRSADPDRPAFEFVGVYDDGSFESRALGEVQRTATRVTLREIRIDVVASALSMPPRRLDRITRLDTGVEMEIADEPMDTAGRYSLRVVTV